MTLCAESILVNQGQNQARAVTLYCNSWGCDICAPRRRDRLIAQIAGGKPQRFLTLTTRRVEGQSPEREAKFLALSWRRLLRTIRKRWPKVDHQYFVVFEAHKSGWPHMHVALRGCFIPWAWLSTEWEKLTGSTHVHIKAVDNPGRVGAYCAKYMAKATHRFGTCKRYWCSKKWEVEPPPERQEDGAWSSIWEPRTMTRRQLASMWESMGWLLWWVDETLYGGTDPPIGVKVIPAAEVWG